LVRQDSLKAEEMFKKAVTANPTHVNSLGNYGLFLLKEKRDIYTAEEYLERAAHMAQNPKQVPSLDSIFCSLLTD
jgi:Tfp pilus assembly protein PilF